MNNYFKFFLLGSFILQINVVKAVAIDSSLIKKENIESVVYLVGDAGESNEKSNILLQELVQQTNQNNLKNTIIFLGDNIYYSGLPNKNEKGFESAKLFIKHQITIIKKANATIYYIPGNHDWNKGKKNGLSHIINEEKYINSHFRYKSFLLKNGCPGPKEVKISKNLTLIALDTQWWLHQFEKGPITTGDCKYTTPKEITNQLKDILDNNKDKDVLVIGHHPIYSYGEHGGYFSLKNHLFPLTNLNSKLYIPLPIIGSLYPFARSNIGNIQDIHHPKYQTMITSLLSTFKGFDNLIYAAGHEHNLQYINRNNQHFIISGSGSLTSPVREHKSEEFATSNIGFAKLINLKNGAIILQFWILNHTSFTIAFEKKIIPPHHNNVTKKDTNSLTTNILDGFKTVIAGENYKAGKFKTFFLGAHYRKEWTTPVKVPVINLAKEHGGLTPIKKGGGMQTHSLRLQGADGNQYVLRSIQKDPSSILPKALWHTIASEIVQDQISTSHPYGAFVIPPMAKAAGIYHTIPKLVFVPNDPHLGKYQKSFANTLMLYEQRAAHDVASIKNFGNATNAISSPQLIKKIMNHNNVIVDQQELARNRLFDMLLGDWDRHEDQWRWAEFTCKKQHHDFCQHLPHNTTYYIPIPRDRDQAFVKFDGLIPRLAGRRWIVRKWQNFDDDIRDIAGINYNARFLDRSFLTNLDKKEWLNIARDMQKHLTDSIIRYAIRLWPDTIYNISGKSITEKLIARKNKLNEFADRYYKVLAKKVNVVGSNQREYFEVIRKNDTITTVNVYNYQHAKKGDRFYHRNFNRNETKEIRLYGLKGKDEFDIKGNVKKGILIRVIGGTGNDFISDYSTVKGWTKKTKYYDTKKEDNQIVCERKSELKNLTSYQKSINEFNRKSFKYDILLPQIFIGYNIDDGLFLGGGASFKHFGFRKKPYSYFQKFVANRALKSNSFNIIYAGKFVDFIKDLDLKIDFSINAPNSTTNFYGFGNETKVNTTVGSNFNLIRFNEILLQPSLIKNIGLYNKISLGAIYQFIDIKNSPNRFISTPEGKKFNTKAAKDYLGLVFAYNFVNTDNKIIPTRGFAFKNTGSWNINLNEATNNFGRISSQFTLFVPLPLKMVYAANVKGVHIINKFQFYQAATLGAKNRSHNNGDLRGFRRDRFSGRTSLSFNQELRIKLFKFHTYLFPIQFGILGFYDTGRVWSDNENSTTWHHDLGGGIWISPLNKAVINATYTVSNEEKLFTLKLGFLF